jgi:membrane protease YdiL (CAAX protease family)
VVIAAIASLSYAARFAESGPARADVLFRWSTAIGTFVIDGILLALTLLIARGLPLRDAFALRSPPSWPRALRIAAVALAATWTTSLILELVAGHAAREQAVPQYWDPSATGAFVANALAIAVFVPIVEESLCRGIGFTLFQRWGDTTAIAATAIGFALAHGAVLDLPWVLVTGAGLGYLRSRTGSLYPCVALHLTVNGIAVLVSASLGAGAT